MLEHRKLVISWIFVLALAGCGAGDEPSTETSGSEGSATGGTVSTAVTTSDGASSGETTGDSTGAGSACTPSGVPEAEATRTVEAASVTVAATLLNALEHCAKDELAIWLVLDTHSVDLLSYDIISSAILTTSDGVSVDDGFVWEGGSESSHHRDGTLRVAAPPLMGAAWLRLTLPGVAGVDRTFEWDAELLAHDLP